jgi:nitrite reductase/ring-hydroxylating ferredoxin subunit
MKPFLERNPSLVVAATYRRDVVASLERVWENVFDWEHLPWLHATTFRAIERLAEDRFGWRARVHLARGGEAEIELVADRTSGRYVVRTLAGIGTGTEIWTQLGTQAEVTVAVAIEFCVRPVPSAAREAIGRGYVEMYARLWDEDEGMIRRRETALVRRREPKRRGDAAQVEVSLGTEAELRARLPVEFELGQECFQLVDVAGELVARASECPHRLGPLAPCPDSKDTLVCSWHGYRFDTNDGRELAGRKLRLACAPRLSRDSATGRITARLSTHISTRISSPAEPPLRADLERDEER